jgi:hypothetical protein
MFLMLSAHAFSPSAKRMSTRPGATGMPLTRSNSPSARHRQLKPPLKRTKRNPLTNNRIVLSPVGRLSMHEHTQLMMDRAAIYSAKKMPNVAAHLRNVWTIS